MKNKIQVGLMLFFYAFLVGITVIGCQKIVENAPPPGKTEHSVKVKSTVKLSKGLKPLESLQPNN